MHPDWRVQSADSWAQDDFYARYTLKPGKYPDLFGCSARIDSLGARGPEPRRPEVLSLGDSCTFGVGLREPESYPGWLSANGVETVNAGVPGYNTETALARLRHSSLLALRPKMVAIYFGWNDLAREAADERTFAVLRRLARYSRCASVLLRLQRCYWEDGWRNFRWVPQVSLAEFRRNLTEMVSLSRRVGAEAVLITPPSEPRLLAEDRRWAAEHSPAEFDDHERYAQAVREVAVQTGAGLIDLDREMRSRAGKDPRRYFIDPIHLNHRGSRVLAQMLLARLAARK